jgi:pSer/pThr/pTyr-binding forkhead associated (FHA) protein
LARFRLRFLLQEIDLPQGDTLIGRSAGCQVTLDDPLVSREHARIRIAGGVATVEDLGSRNGVQLGGQLITRSAPLSNGDRIRIGTQELVFFSGAGQRDWGIELAAEAVNRARVAGTGDLERVLAHARLGLEQRLAEGRSIDRELIDNVALAAAEIAVKRGEAGWGRWGLSIYASLGWAPPAALSEALTQLPKAELLLLGPAAQRALDSAGVRQAGEDRASLDALTRLLESAQP